MGGFIHAFHYKGHFLPLHPVKILKKVSLINIYTWPLSYDPYIRLYGHSNISQWVDLSTIKVTSSPSTQSKSLRRRLLLRLTGKNYAMDLYIDLELPICDFFTLTNQNPLRKKEFIYLFNNSYLFFIIKIISTW